MKSGVKVIQDKLKDLDKSLASLATTRVLVGIPAIKAERRGEDTISNAAIGYIMENGSPIKNIPARPFLVPGVKAAHQAIVKALRQIGQNALEGNANAVEQGYQALGLLGQSAVKKKIVDGPFEPLAESTLAARRRRGVTRTKPLIDTAQLLNSISYVVRNIGQWRK